MEKNILKSAQLGSALSQKSLRVAWVLAYELSWPEEAGNCYLRLRTLNSARTIAFL
jgi:hypothetical protein